LRNLSSQKPLPSTTREKKLYQLLGIDESNILTSSEPYVLTITDLMARDPDAIAGGAMVVNQAFETGAVEHSLTAHGRWSETVTVDGEPLQLTIRRHWW
jgi:hypothetical protein